MKHFLIFIFLVSPLAVANEDEILPPAPIDMVTNFSKLSQLAAKENKIIMLEMSASYCGFCITLEEEIIRPMIRSHDYEETVLIRQIKIDYHDDIIGPDGNKTTPAQLARDLNIFVTPTLLFLNAENQEVSERILGVNSLDYFGYYVDEAIDQGLIKIRN